MTGKNRGKAAKKIVLLACVGLVAFMAVLMSASSDVEIERYTALDQQNLSEESNEALKEYYGSVLSAIGEESKFNTISTKEDIAILNVTVDGKDRRILTRLSKGVALQKPATDSIFAQSIRSYNLTVLGNLEISGREFFPIETSFGARNFFSMKSGSEKLVEEGSSRLTNGMANVSINPIFAETISGYNVYLSPSGLTRGIYVEEKAESYFIVKSANKKSNVGFSWLLSGTPSSQDEGLNGDEIRIIVVIAPENNIAEIEIYGLEMQNAIDSSAITGNVVLEENLSSILEDEPTPLPEIVNNGTGGKNEPGNEENADNGNGNEQEPESDGNKTKTAKFKISSIDEGYIISRISGVSGLSEADVKRFIRFDYKAPEYHSSEEISGSFPEGIEYADGSIIIRLGKK